MEAVLTKPKLNIDKSNWKPVKLGDVVDEPRETAKDPDAEGIKYVLGLEHIETEDIHIRSYDTTEESTSFTRKFRESDVLFGRRRAYLKKAAIAPFTGICSGDIIVMRAKDELLPELLPFIINNDKFFDYAVKHSAGGLSPRVKFKDLANYEFLLPPSDQQAQLSELLWELDDMIESFYLSKKKYSVFFKRYMYDLVSGKLSNNFKSWKEYSLKDLAISFSGLRGKSKKDFGEGEPFITYMNVFSNSKINPSEIDRVKISNGENQHELMYGDIILTGSSETPEEVGMSSVVLDNIKGYYMNSFCFGFRLNDFKTLLPEFARFLFRGREVRSFMFKHAQGSTRFNLSKKTVKDRLSFKLPSIPEQKEMAQQLDFMESIIIGYEAKIKNSKLLQKSLINQIF